MNTKFNSEDYMRKANYTKPLSVGFSPEQYDYIKKLSDDIGVSMADVVRESVTRCLDNFEEIFQVEMTGPNRKK